MSELKDAKLMLYFYVTVHIWELLLVNPFILRGISDVKNPFHVVLYVVHLKWI